MGAAAPGNLLLKICNQGSYAITMNRCQPLPKLLQCKAENAIYDSEMAQLWQLETASRGKIFYTYPNLSTRLKAIKTS